MTLSKIKNFLTTGRGIIIGAIGGAVIGATGGGIIGGFISGGGGTLTQQSGGSNADFEAYIRQNSGLIIDILTDHNIQKAENERQQSLNLVKVNDGNTIIGNPDGDVTIYEFADYNCGYCKRVFTDLMAVVREDGNIRLVVKEFPILSESSFVAAQISLAAAELGEYASVHEQLMVWNGSLNDDVFDQILSEAGLSRDEIDAVIAKGEIDKIIADNRQAATAVGVQGTPAFVIGDNFVPGAIDKARFEALIAEVRGDNS